VLLSKDEYNETAWQKAVEIGKFEVIEILWDWAKKLKTRGNKK
jgi:hypothetical protein